MQLPIKVFKQTTGYTCGPAALKTFLNYHKLAKGLTEQQLAELLNTCPLKGTKFEVIYTFLWSRGINITSERSDSNIDLHPILDGGKVILTEWIDWGGHFVNICGYDDTHFYLADSFTESDNGVIKVLKDRFLSMWFTKNEKHASLLYLT